MTTGIRRTVATGMAATIAMVWGCALSPAPVPAAAPIPAFADAGSSAPTAPPILPDHHAFLELDPAMRAWAREHLARIVDPAERMRSLTRLLLDPSDRGIVYDPTLTRSASELFRERTGNCLSFAGLYVALAREVRLTAWFQDVPVLPNWRLDGDAYVVERHVNVIVRAGRNEYVIDFRPPAAVARTRAEPIADSNATAQYFGNLGVERFTAGDLRQAYDLFRRGLEVDGSAAPLWINLGVVMGRNRQFDAAATAYERALALEPDNLSALSNLAGVEGARGNAERERGLLERVADYRSRNPYYQYWLGEGHLRSGNAADALDAFRRAVRQMPEEADFHLALARAWRALGREDEAGRSFRQALRLAPTDGARLRYRRSFGVAEQPS